MKINSLGCLQYFLVVVEIDKTSHGTVAWLSLIVVRHAHTEGTNQDPSNSQLLYREIKLNYGTLDPWWSN